MIHYDVLTVGEPLVLFAATSTGVLNTVEHWKKSAAGAELNVCIGLSRLGYMPAYLTKVGEDSFGQFLKDVMRSEGIRTELVATLEKSSTGFMLKSMQSNGEDPVTEYHRRGSAATQLSIGDAPGDIDYKYLHLSGISSAISESSRELAFHLAQIAKKAGKTVIFDPNLRPRLWASRDEMIAQTNGLARLADVFMPGANEAKVLTGLSDPVEVAEFYHREGISCVVVKLGPEGAYVSNIDGTRTLVPGMKVHRVVDTVGAGDGFAVGVISGLLSGLSLEDSVARGNKIGARVVQYPGDSDGLPTKDQLNELASQ